MSGGIARMDSPSSSWGYFVPYDNQRQLLVCESNSCVKILSREDLECRQVLSISSSSGRCAAVWKNKDGEGAIALATTDNAVRVFGHSGESLGLLLRFSAAVNHMDVNLSQTMLAAASSDFSIKLADTETMQQVAVLSGHMGPVISVKFGPRGKYLASTSADGTLKIWLLEKKECYKTISCLPKCSDASLNHPLGRMAWEGHCGSAVAVPCGRDGIKLFSYDTWTEKTTLCCSGEPKVFSIVCWSLNGRLLAGASLDAYVTIWSAPQLQVVQSVALECVVCCMASAPDVSDGLTVMDTKGHLYPLKVETEDIGNEQDDFPDDIKEGSDVDNLDVYDDALLDEVDVDETDWKQERKRNHSEVDHADMSDDGEDYMGSSAMERQSYKKRKTSESTYLLPAFQIGETPRGTPNRFMVYNSVGIVRSHEGDSSSIATVEVEFHDIATYHALTIANPVNYEMASLTSRSLALASKGDDDSSSQLHCVHFEDWDSSKEWTVTMDKREHIQAVTQGHGWVAVATNILNLRLFSTGGVQKGLLSLPGPLLTMAGFRQKLAVVFQGGPDAFGRPLIHLCEYNVMDLAKSLDPTVLPLSPKGTLKWLGYSMSGVLASYDSEGVLRVAPSTNRTHWVPVLNTSKLKSKHDAYFAVELSSDPDEFRCILCKGAEYPLLHPRPMMMTLPLQVPLCDVTSERGKLEEELVRQRTLQPANATGIAKCLMKMFALACKSGRQMRAVEVAEMFPNQQCLSVALTYSSKHRLHGLSERISQAIQTVEEEEELATDLEPDSVVDEPFNARRSASSLSCASHQLQSQPEAVVGAPQSVLLSRATNLPGKRPQSCMDKTFSSGKTLAAAEAEDIGKMCEPEDASAQPLPANPFKTSVRASSTRGESVLQSMAKATGEMVKKKDVKADPQKKGEALDAQSSKVQQNLKMAFLTSPAVHVPAPSTAPAKANRDSASEQTNGSGPSGFSKWFSESKHMLQQAHVEASHEELVKLGIKQWRAMAKEEKQQWQ